MTERAYVVVRRRDVRRGTAVQFVGFADLSNTIQSKVSALVLHTCEFTIRIEDAMPMTYDVATNVMWLASRRFTGTFALAEWGDARKDWRYTNQILHT